MYHSDEPKYIILFGTLYMLDLTNVVKTTVSGRPLQYVSRDGGISPWVASFIEHVSVGEFLAERWCPAGRYNTPAVTAGFPHGWRAL